MNVILNNGIKFPRLGFGTYQIRSPEVEKMVNAALMHGYRLIDTAACYKNESSIGQVLKSLIGSKLLREDIFVTSKLPPSHQGYEKSRECVLESLESLQLEYLDLYLIHWPGASRMKPEDTQHAQLRKESWLQLENLYKEGKVKAIGVSNYNEYHLEELFGYCSVKPAVLQVEVHPYLTQNSLIQFCKQNNIHVQAYSSLGSKSGSSELLFDETVTKIANNHNKNSAQILLRWAIQKDMSVIPRTINTEHLISNMQIFDFELTTEEMHLLSSLNKGKHYCWDPADIR